jgi:aminopeptidase
MYTPPQKIIDRYAKVLVRFALGGGKGIKKGDTVMLSGSEVTRPMFLACRREIIEAGGHVIMEYQPDNFGRFGADREFFLKAKGHQIAFFPEKYIKGLINEIDHLMYLLSETDKQSLQGVPPKKIMQRGEALKQWMDWRNEKEHKGKFSWTLALYGTEAMAAEAGLSIEEYWDQIIKACFLDEEQPIQKWRQVSRDIERLRKKLNSLTPGIDQLHVFGPDVDLWITPGAKRQWLGGGGRNIPSFELFMSPDWRGTEGKIKFNMPLYRYGYLIEGIELEFKNGKVVRSKATKNTRVLKEMIRQKNADKVGEYSLTDRRFSRITKFMAETLFDENVGGQNGNTHIALGNSYAESYTGDVSKLNPAALQKLGFNDSSVHTDIMSTTPRTVSAHMKDGSERVIYKGGEFTL